MYSSFIFRLLSLFLLTLATVAAGNESNVFIFRGLTVGQSTQQDLLSSSQWGKPIIAISSGEDLISYYFKLSGFRPGDYNAVVVVKNQRVHTIDVMLPEGTSTRESVRVFNLGSPSIADPRSEAASLGSYVSPSLRPVHYDAGAAVLFLDDRNVGRQNASMVRFYAPNFGYGSSGSYNAGSSQATPVARSQPLPEQPKAYKQRVSFASGSANQTQNSRTQKNEVTIFAEGNYRGVSHVFKGGQAVNDLNRIPGGSRRLDNHISSIRISGSFSAVLYKEPDFKGDSVTIVESISNMGNIMTTEGTRLRWNDAVSSIKIFDNSGEDVAASGASKPAGALYAAGNYGDKSLQLFEGQSIPDLREYGLDNHASSMKVVRGYQIELYEYANYQGETVVVDRDQPNMKRVQNSLSFSHWNDRASSLKVSRK